MNDNEQPEVKTVRVRINVDENSPPRTKAGERMRDLVDLAKKIVRPSEEPFRNNKEE